jgi:hypothetical protein
MKRRHRELTRKERETYENEIQRQKADELRLEYDLAALLKGGARGKYAKRYDQGQTSFYCRRTWQGISQMMKP